MTLSFEPSKVTEKVLIFDRTFWHDKSYISLYSYLSTQDFETVTLLSYQQEVINEEIGNLVLLLS